MSSRNKNVVPVAVFVLVMLVLGFFVYRGLEFMKWRTLGPEESKSVVHLALHGQESVNWVVKSAVKRDGRDGSQWCKLEAPPTEVEGLAEFVSAAWKAAGAKIRQVKGFHGLPISGEDSPGWWKPENLRDPLTLAIDLGASGYVLVISSTDGTILICAWTT